MNHASFRFYATLNDFLPPHRQQVAFDHYFQESASVKDMIEALGVPHPEIDLILANAQSVDFAYRVQNGDRLSVYPRFASINIASFSLVRPAPLLKTRFVLDLHLGKLANYLRLLGFDTLYRNDYQDQELARISSQEQRILLTRDRGLLKRSVVEYGYCVRQFHPWQQLIEILQRFELFNEIKPFQRCLRCNSFLEPVDKDRVSDRLPLKTKQYFDEFYRCQKCQQVYWKGSHYQQMLQFVERVREQGR